MRSLFVGYQNDLHSNWPIWLESIQLRKQWVRICSTAVPPALPQKLTILQRSSGSKEIATEKLHLAPGTAISFVSPPHARPGRVTLDLLPSDFP